MIYIDGCIQVRHGDTPLPTFIKVIILSAAWKGEAICHLQSVVLHKTKKNPLYQVHSPCPLLLAVLDHLQHHLVTTVGIIGSFVWYGL